MTSIDEQTFHSESEEATTQLAQALASQVEGGTLISLEGDLGSGKTFFARAFGRALGITQNMTSPTFVLQKSYNILGIPRVTQLVHYDLYRINDYSELLDMGFEDFDSSTIVLAEWGNLFISEFPVKPVRIRLEPQSTDSRLISVSGLSKLLIMP